MTVTPTIAPAFALLDRSRFQRQTRRLNWLTRCLNWQTRRLNWQTRRLNWQTGRFRRKQTRENVCGLCLDANRCNQPPEFRLFNLSKTVLRTLKSCSLSEQSVYH